MDWITLGQIALFGILIAQIANWVIKKKKAKQEPEPFNHAPPLPGPMT